MISDDEAMGLSCPCDDEGRPDWCGTLNGYTNRLCRGEACRAAQAAYMRNRRGDTTRGTCKLCPRTESHKGLSHACNTRRRRKNFESVSEFIDHEIERGYQPQIRSN